MRLAKRRDHMLVTELLDELFVFERTKPRLEILMDGSRTEIAHKKRILLDELRRSHVYVLEKGTIEFVLP